MNWMSQTVRSTTSNSNSAWVLLCFEIMHSVGNGGSTCSPSTEKLRQEASSKPETDIGHTASCRLTLRAPLLCPISECVCAHVYTQMGAFSVFWFLLFLLLPRSLAGEKEFVSSVHHLPGLFLKLPISSPACLSNLDPWIHIAP